MKRKAKFNILLVGRRKFEWNFDWTPIYDVLEEMHTDDYEEVLDWVDELRMYPLKRFVFDFFDEKLDTKHVSEKTVSSFTRGVDMMPIKIQ